MKSFQDKTLDDSIPISQQQDAVNELQKHWIEMHTMTRMGRGFCFPLKFTLTQLVMSIIST
jgi:hypothetical protein